MMSCKSLRTILRKREEKHSARSLHQVVDGLYGKRIMYDGNVCCH